MNFTPYHGRNNNNNNNNCNFSHTKTQIHWTITTILVMRYLVNSLPFDLFSGQNFRASPLNRHLDWITLHFLGSKMWTSRSDERKRKPVLIAVRKYTQILCNKKKSRRSLEAADTGGSTRRRTHSHRIIGHIIYTNTCVALLLNLLAVKKTFFFFF